ncbi:AI-2E family transporter, partial [Streptomyces sp. NPDC058000]
GTALMGAVGALIAIPATATLQAFLGAYVKRYEVTADPRVRLWARRRSGAPDGAADAAPGSAREAVRETAGETTRETVEEAGRQSGAGVSGGQRDTVPGGARRDGG